MSADGPKLRKAVGQSMSALPGNSDLNLFRYREGIVYFDAEIPDRTFDLRVTEQELHGSQIAGASVNQRCLGPA